MVTRYADQRIVRDRSASLLLEETAGDGTAPPTPGVWTIGVVDALGDVVVPPGEPTTDEGDGVHAYQLDASDNDAVTQLTCTWSEAGGAELQTVVDVGADWYWSTARARASDPMLGDSVKHGDADIAMARDTVETECDYITGTAWTTRYRVQLLDGSGTDLVWLSERPNVELVQVSLDGTVLDPAGYRLKADGALERDGVWSDGAQNIEVHLTFGHTAPPPDLVRAQLVRLRHVLSAPRTAIPDRATSWTSDQGVAFDLATAGVYATGIPEVDAAYQRYSLRDTRDPGGDGGRGNIASRPLDWNPQQSSLFHGGRV